MHQAMAQKARQAQLPKRMSIPTATVMTASSLLKKHVRLHLNNEKKSYFSGDTVAGTVTLDVSEPVKVTGIYVKLKGEGVVQWNEVVGQTSKGKDKTRNLHEDKRFLREFITLWSPGSTSTSVKEIDKKIQMGVYKFNWDFKLPLSLPSSFKCQHGSIKYSIKVTVEKPWSFNWTDEREIIVMTHCDLDTMRGAQNPIQLQKQIEVGGTFRSKRPVSVEVRLASQGLLVREKIPIGVNINNMSPRDVSSSSLQLRQDCTMLAEGYQKVVSKIVFKAKQGKVEAGHKGTWEDVSFALFDLATSGGVWKSVQIAYMAIFTVEVGGHSMQLEWPVYVGSHRGGYSIPSSAPSPSLSHSPSMVSNDSPDLHRRPPPENPHVGPYPTQELTQQYYQDGAPALPQKFAQAEDGPTPAPRKSKQPASHSQYMVSDELSSRPEPSAPPPYSPPEEYMPGPPPPLPASPPVAYPPYAPRDRAPPPGYYHQAPSYHNEGGFPYPQGDSTQYPHGGIAPYPHGGTPYSNMGGQWPNTAPYSPPYPPNAAPYPGNPPSYYPENAQRGGPPPYNYEKR